MTSPSSSTNRLRINNFNSNLNTSLSLNVQCSLYEDYTKLESRNMTKTLDLFIDDMLPLVRSVLMKDNNDNTENIIRLQEVARDEGIWLSIILRLIDRIKLNDQLGPSIISIFIEETPLPSQEQITMLLDTLRLNDVKYNEKIQRNILVVFSCLSEKIAGTSIASFLAEKTIDFIFNCLENGNNLSLIDDINDKNSYELIIVLFALITLENFSKSSKNKFIIAQELSKKGNTLLFLSSWHKHQNHIKHQIGFLAQYLLDNIFTPENHIYGYTKYDYKNTNVRLNDDDTSENLKISPDGLEARNDALSFESARSTVQVDNSCWFYEATLLTNGIMQIGFATKSAGFLNDQGFGIGDDQFSVGFDGCRSLIWYNADPYPTDKKFSWKEGDVVGLLLDISQKKVMFYLNGILVTPVHTDLFRKVNNGIFPAASLMSFQHILFNFGKDPFKYPPSDINFNCFNSYGVLEEKECYVLPKRLKLEKLRKTLIKDDACSICCENISNVNIVPCKHKLFCENCVKRLSMCPICRSPIVTYEVYTN
ncbi:unnamed protein product [Brachionus calyciflorus]|uniref:Uncharacterized protein n=1 Tax=Brachionus calyciflorus TaxID=104777 RepID=A0A813MA27_9BILA|nr:unnamed protein product [Brachionus calyciflorus]